MLLAEDDAPELRNARADQLDRIRLSDECGNRRFHERTPVTRSAVSVPVLARNASAGVFGVAEYRKKEVKKAGMEMDLTVPEDGPASEVCGVFGYQRKAGAISAGSSVHRSCCAFRQLPRHLHFFFAVSASYFFN